jgi:hypothetical protein
MTDSRLNEPSIADNQHANAICRECGSAFVQSRAGVEFCGPTCRRVWNNRRLRRGAILYDLFMASRYELGEAKRLKLWREMNRLAALWREEDRVAGRKSYSVPAVVIARLQDDGRLPRGELLCTNAAGVRR